MRKTSGLTDESLDQIIERIAECELKDVVHVSEGMNGKSREFISFPRKGTQNAGQFLVCRLFTDAIFSNDIRAIQLIVNRIDGGIPKDEDMGSYRTKFADCFSIIMKMENAEKLKLAPDDTVIMGLCKSLYALAVQDIWWKRDIEGNIYPCKPSTDKKNERDSALRMVLDRTGGKKTTPVEARETEEIESADWIASLPMPS